MRILLCSLAMLAAHAAALAGQAPRVAVSPNLRIAPGLHNEPWVAVSPTNPNILLAAAQQGDGTFAGGYRFGVSTFISRDGGRLWIPVNLPNAPATPFDVMVAGGPDGRLYLMSGVVGGAWATQLLKEAPPKSLIRFWSSTDNGFTWEAPTDLASSVDPDHMRMAIDMSNTSTRGRIYVAWNDVADQFVRDQYEIFLQWSDDHGKTFNAPKLIATGTDGKLVATEPVVLSDGSVLVTYYQYFNPLARRDNEHMPMYVARSSDHGKTFAAPTKIFEFGPHVWRERVTEFSRAFSLPIVTSDTSSRSAYRDRIYITWDDVSGGTSNIWFVKSVDKGRSWSKAVRINDNTTDVPNGVKDFRMTPVVAVNPTGALGIAWYDRRNDPNRMCWDFFGAFSTDGGGSFSPNVKLTSAPSCPPPATPPSVGVFNVSPRLADPNQRPDSVIDQLATMERLGARIVKENIAARDEANKGRTTSRLTLSFDPSRNMWPGHYTGLTADQNGVFHAVWLDRREGTQQLFTARLTLGDSAPGTLSDADLTHDVEVMSAPPTYDPAKKIATVGLQLRNVTSTRLYGPMSVRLSGGGFDSTVTFATKLGTCDCLTPGDISEPIVVSLPVAAERGFDAAFDFTVAGRKRSTAPLPAGKK